MNQLKFSHYNIAVEKSENGMVRISNGLNRSIIDLSKEDYELLKNNPDALLEKPGCDQAIKTLIELGVIVPAVEDEIEKGQKWFKKINTERSHFRTTILPTYMCNLACPYCVEEGVKEPNFMDTLNAASVSQWMERIIEQDNCSDLTMTFYGGEPLLNLPAVLMISRYMQKVAEKRNMRISNGMITNGVKLTKDVARQLKEVGLTKVKITLDGYKDVHDKYRKTMGNRGSFDTIMENIHNTLGMFDLRIGANYDEGNFESIKELLLYLKSEGYQEYISEVSLKPIMSTLGQKYGADTACTACAMSEQDIHKIADINEFAARLGFKVYDRSQVGPCPAITYHNYIVDPDGYIYKCPGFVGHKEHAIGTIWSGIADVKDAFRNLELDDKCKTCSHLPTCAGGCRYGAYVKNGDTDQLLCEKEYLETAGPRFINMQ